MASDDMPQRTSDGFDGVLEMTSKFIDEAANAPAPPRRLRRGLWVVFAVVGALVALGWSVLLFGD
jgi:hypothetical protein